MKAAHQLPAVPVVEVSTGRALTADPRRLYWQGVADGRAEGERQRASGSFWSGFIAGSATVVAWVAAMLLIF